MVVGGGESGVVDEGGIVAERGSTRGTRIERRGGV